MYIPTGSTSNSGPGSQPKQQQQLMNELLLCRAMLRAGSNKTSAEPNILATGALPVHDPSTTANLDVLSASKCYDPKMPTTLVPPLLIDADNYMLREARPRSLSHGALQRPARTHTQSQSSPLDLDMFCVRESVNSLAGAVPKLADSSDKVCEKRVADEPQPPLPASQVTSSEPSCARTLSLHSMLCTCRLTCCCVCVSLCSLDCSSCLHNVCARFSSGTPCRRNPDISSPPTFSVNKVSTSHPISVR